MQRSRSVLFAGLLAAPLMLVSSAALAGGPDACFLTADSCAFEVTGGCQANCTPGNFTADCETQCTEKPQKVCVNTCQTSCEATCTAHPGSFDCKASCTQDCEPNCTTLCAGNANADCATICKNDCENRCTVNCQATPPSVDCSAGCQTSCGTSCTVQENVECQTKCVVDVEPAQCKASCSSLEGGLFCDGQYIDLDKAGSDCVAWIESQGFSASGSCEATLGGSSCAASVGCSAAPSLGAASDRWGVAGLTGLMMGLGLFISRRRRR